MCCISLGFDKILEKNASFKNTGWTWWCSDYSHTTLAQAQSAHCLLISYRQLIREFKNQSEIWVRVPAHPLQGSTNNTYDNTIFEEELITFHFSLYWFYPQWLFFPSLTFASSHGYFLASSYFTCGKGNLCCASSTFLWACCLTLCLDRRKGCKQCIFLPPEEEIRTAPFRKRTRISRKAAWWFTTPCGLWLNWSIWT